MNENTYMLSKEEFLKLKAHWSKTCRNRTSAEMLIYNLLRSKPARNGFAAKTKGVQSNNPWQAFYLAKAAAHYQVFRMKKYGTFEEKFGIQIPDGFEEMIVGCK